MTKNILISVLIMSIFTQCTSQNLETVPEVDLDRYAGVWHEIASFPQRFQKGCHCTTATYTKSDKGYIVVENRCNKEGVQGKESYIKGKAFIDPGSGNSKLKVQSEIQKDQLRIRAKKKDDLQAVIALLKEKDLGIHIEFVNYR